MCGIVAIYSNSQTNKNYVNIKNLLLKLQHRGKDGCGIGYYINKEMRINKGKGKVNQVFDNLYQNLTIKSCIGHVRYATSGESMSQNVVKINEVQPLSSNKGDFLLAHNGNIPSIKVHDSGYIINFLENQEGNFVQKLIKLMNTIPASYSIVILTNDNKIYALRDRYGIRPLCVGYVNNNYYISSESSSFQNKKKIRDVYPGEIIKIGKNGIESLYIHPEAQLSLCSFELIYFMNEYSVTDNYHVGNTRRKLGNILAQKETLKDKDYMLVGVPKTGICSAISYALELNLEYKQVIKKNKLKDRTFIIIDNETRIKECNEKFYYDKENIKDKKIIVVDDSIVRGNIIKAIIINLKLAGAKEIHVRIPAPPVIDICQLGIAIKTKEELIMHNKTEKEVCKEINADSLKYLSLDDLNFFPEKSYNECFGGGIDSKIVNYNT